MPCPLGFCRAVIQTLPSFRGHGVAALNGFDVQGRKLRVEYKKVLQAGEKEHDVRKSVGQVAPARHLLPSSDIQLTRDAPEIPLLVTVIHHSIGHQSL